MVVLSNIALVLCLAVKPDLAVAQDSFCVTGFVMDKYCIDNKRMIDNGKETLKEPETHSIHCLVDIPKCRDSGFEILAEPKNADGEYTRVAELDDFGNTEALALARKTGDDGPCSTCTGEGEQRSGFRATVKGTLDPDSSLSEVPRVLVTEVLPETELCPDAPTAAPTEPGSPTTGPTSDAVDILPDVFAIFLCFAFVLA